MDGDVAEFRQLWVAAGEPDGRTGVLGLAGRRSELRTLRRHLESGAGLLIVQGEAGIGKTSLVNAAVSSAPVTVAVGRCLPLSREVPLLPVVDLLRRLHQVDGGAWLDGALRTCPAQVRDAIGMLLPELDTDSPADDTWGVHRLFAAVGSVLAALRTTRAMALLIEDLHWSDASTLDLLEHLLDTDPHLPLVATFRVDDPRVAPRNAEWALRAQRKPRTRAISVGLLDRRDTRDQLRMLWAHEPDEDELEQIFTRTKGQPLFTDQLARSELHGHALPELLTELLDDRLGPLEGDPWAVASTLGLADRPLAFGLLAEASGLDADRTTSALRELHRRHLLRTGPSGSEPALQHPLMSEAIQRRLVPGEGPLVHGRLAATLSRAPEPRAAEIARHWEEAADPQRALVWWVHAADAASDRFALDEMHTALRRALELWPRGSRTVPDVEYPLFEMYAIAIDNAAAHGRADVAVQWAREALDLDLEDEQRVVILRIAGEIQFRSGYPDDGFVLLGRAIDLHQTMPPAQGFIDTLQWRASHLIEVGAWGAADADLDRARSLAAELGNAQRERMVVAAKARLCGLRGQFDEAEKLFAHARSLPASPGEDINGDVRFAVREVDVMLREAAPVDEIIQKTSAAVIRARELGFDWDSACILTLQLCEAWLRLGETKRAAETVDLVWDSELTFAVAPRHLAKALVELRTGLVAESASRQQAVASLSGHTAMELDWAVHHADIQLWTERPGDATQGLEEALNHLLRGDGWHIASTVAAMWARAHADLADQAALDRSRRKQVAERISHVITRAHGSPFSGAAAGRQVRADGAVWRAETARLTDTATVEMWVVAASEWEALSRPHDAAYCRWRGAQVALQSGQGTVARRLLKQAARDAAQHVPLGSAIADTRRTLSGRDRA